MDHPHPDQAIEAVLAIKSEPGQEHLTETRLQRVERELKDSGWTRIETRGSDVVWEPERWRRMIQICKETRWQPIFQDVEDDQTSEGDGMRHQLVVGLRANPEEIACIEQLQEVHDTIFEVQQVQPGLHHRHLDSDPKGLAGTRTKKEDPTKTDWTRRFGMARQIQLGKDPTANRNPRVTAALRSRPPCKVQHGHADALYNPKAGTTGYLSMLAPLSAPAKLRIWTGCHKLMEMHHNKHGLSLAQWNSPQPELEAEARQMLGLGPDDILAPEEVEAQVGQIILFVQHDPHQGASWYGPGDNIRLHTYLYPTGVPFPAKTSTVILPAWINKICGIINVADEPPPTGERETRGQRRARQNRYRAAAGANETAGEAAGGDSGRLNAVEVIVIDSDEDEFVGQLDNVPGTREAEEGSEHPGEGECLLESHTTAGAPAGKGKEPKTDVSMTSQHPDLGVWLSSDDGAEGSAQDLKGPPTDDEEPGLAMTCSSPSLGAAGDGKEGRLPPQMGATHSLAKKDENWVKYTARQRRNKKRRWNRVNYAGGARQEAVAGGVPGKGVDEWDGEPDSPEREENPGCSGGMAAQRDRQDPLPRVQGQGHP